MRAGFPKKFRLGIVLIFIAMLVLTTAAMIMIERMIPLHDKELLQIVEQQTVLHDLSAGSRLSQTSTPYERESLNKALLQLAQADAWSVQQQALIPRVQEAFSESSSVEANELAEVLQNLVNLQSNRLNEKLESMRLKGLAGSWTVGLLSLFTMVGLYRFYVRTRDSVLAPTQEIVQGLHDFHQGNRQRRFRSHLHGGEFHESLSILNDILDERSTRRTLEGQYE